jgi:RNA polymerase sigma factor (sigma-70 family)
MSGSALHHAVTPYEEHKGYVLRVLALRCGWIEQTEREGLYHEAYAVLLDKQRRTELDVEAMTGQQVRAYLLQTALHKALDEGKRAERRLTEPLERRGLDQPDPTDQLDALSAEVDAAAVREIVAGLPERARAIVKLRFYFDRKPREIRRLLGISARAYDKEYARAVGRIAERYELVRQGRWCESRRSVVLAYVAGIAGPRKTVEARMHLRSCPGCARMAVELREAAERAAAMMPLPDLALRRGPLERAADAMGPVREGLVDLGAAAKQQLATLAGRAPDPTPLAGARPGAATAVIAGCLAFSGGATYCAVEGIPDPLRASFGAEQMSDEARDETQQPKQAEDERAPPTPLPVSQAPEPQEPTAEPPQQEPPAPPVQQPTPEPPPPPPNESAEREFGFEQASPTPRETPAPAGQGGEFTPEGGAASGGPPESGGNSEFGFEQ